MCSCVVTFASWLPAVSCRFGFLSSTLSPWLSALLYNPSTTCNYPHSTHGRSPSMERGVSPQEPSETVQLDLYWNAASNDHMLVATQSGKDEAAQQQYKFIRSVGHVFKEAQEGLVPLIQLWSPVFQDHALVAGGRQEVKGYNQVRTEGWAYKVKEVVTGSLPLTTYWSERRKDTVSVADKGTSEEILSASCYVLRRIEARILPLTSASPTRVLGRLSPRPKLTTPSPSPSPVPSRSSIRLCSPSETVHVTYDPDVVSNDTPRITEEAIPNYDSATLQKFSGMEPHEIHELEKAVTNIQRMFRGHKARMSFKSLKSCGWDNVVDMAIDKHEQEKARNKMITLESVLGGLDELLLTTGVKSDDIVQLQTLTGAIKTKYSEMFEEIHKQRELDRQRLAKVREIVAEGKPKPKLKAIVEKFSNSILKVVGLLQERDLDDQLDSQQTAWETEPVFKRIVQDDVQGMKDVIRRNPVKTKVRDHFGATPLLVCLLMNGPKKQEMAVWLLQHDPKLAADTYTTEAFDGELALHFAVLARDMRMARLLCEAYPKSVLARATGLFFRGGDNGVYYGESPLMFAITSNQPDMVLYLLEFAETRLGKSKQEMLDERNLDGNTVLHMCVWHNLPEMYKFVEALCIQHKPAFYECGLTTCVNKSKLTPFTLAAERGHIEIFTHLLEINTLTRWTFGPASYRAVFIDEIETISTNEGRPSILELLVENQHMQLLALPLIRNFLTQKWNAYVKRIFLKRIATLLCYVLMFTVAGFREKGTSSGEQQCAGQYTAMFDNNILKQPYNALESWKEYIMCEGIAYYMSKASVFEKIADMGVFFGALHKGKRELSELSEQGLNGYFGVKGAMLLENILSSFFCLTTLLSYVFRYNGSPLEDLLGAASALLLWSYVLWLMLGFKQTGPFIIMIWKMLSNDMLQFLVIFLTFQLGFTQAFHLILDTDPENSMVFFSHLKTSFEVVLGEVQPDIGRDQSAYPNVAYFLMSLYSILVTSILMNLLVAMMSTTYEEIRGEADVIWNMEFSRMILSLESELSQQEKGVNWWTIVDGRRAFMLPMFSEEGTSEYSDYTPDWDAIPQKQRPPTYHPTKHRSPAHAPLEDLSRTPRQRNIVL
eukprot:TRINITY_DN3713_c1_g1_i1.p1 TRINITY_DN3713_c1_g1~~TRINITY_DN3713_c1_g1_i1.p1  ORF type:complete len:1113 (+),score=218.87 TRINITY_DN3713_c1_g1_i1:2009-5347(+)